MAQGVAGAMADSPRAVAPGSSCLARKISQLASRSSQPLPTSLHNNHYAMLSPNEINPPQMARIRELERQAILKYARITGHEVDRKCPEIQRLVCAAVLENAGAWRAELERAAR